MTPVPVAPTNGKILVIDDNPIIQRAVYFQFRDQGYKVLMSGDITSALVLVRQEQPDVILLDINFPNEYSTTSEPRDGFWATKWLQKMDEAKNIPVILISTADPAEAEPRALSVGAVAFIPKPLDKAKLLAAIQKAMADKKTEPPSAPGLKLA